MNYRHLPLNGLRTFEAFGRNLNVAKAAEELGVSASAVSHQLKNLEQLLDEQLVDRREKQLNLTPAGRFLLGVMSENLHRLATSIRRINPALSEGPIRLGATTAICTNWLVDLLTQFTRQHPDIDFELQQIPRLTRDIPGDVDLAICYGMPETRRPLYRLMDVEYFPVASAKLFVKAKVPITLAEVLTYPLLLDPGGMWQQLIEEQKMQSAMLKQSISFFDVSHAIQAALSGQGIAMADSFEVANLLADGDLVRLLDIAIPSAHNYYLVGNNDASVRARIFEDWLKERVKILQSAV